MIRIVTGVQSAARKKPMEEPPVNMNFQQWITQGDALYQNALKEFHAIEVQLDELETRLLAKLAEVNQIAQVLGKPAVESARRAAPAQVAVPAAPVVEEIDRAPAPSNANIARALTGRFGR